MFKVREIQIKMTLEFHLTPVRMTNIKTSSDSTCWRLGQGEHSCIECKPLQLLWKLISWFLRKPEIVVLQDPAIPLLCIYPKIKMFHHPTKTLVQLVHSSFIPNS